MEAVFDSPNLLRTKNIIFDDSVSKAQIKFINSKKIFGVYNLYNDPQAKEHIYNLKETKQTRPIKDDPKNKEQLPIPIVATNINNKPIIGRKTSNDFEPKAKKPRKSAAVLSGISPLSTTKPDLKDLMEDRINDMETEQSSAIPGVRRKQQKFIYGNKFNLV